MTDLVINVKVKDVKNFTTIKHPNELQILIVRLLDEGYIKSEDEVSMNSSDYKKWFWNERKKALDITANKRKVVLIALADKAKQADLLSLYTKLVSSNSMQKILEVWRTAGDTEFAIEEMEKITGTVKDYLDTEVGNKNPRSTVRNEIERAMKSVAD